jgi:hypothetical protein
MGRLKIYGGDFAKGRAWFYPHSGFLLRTKNGRRESISAEGLAVVDEATEETILALGGDEVLLDDLVRVPPSDRSGSRVFIATFDDGRLLLASASSRSYMEICATRRPAERSQLPKPDENVPER